MTPLQNYLQDGANHQAKAVLAFLQKMYVPESWDEEQGAYLAIPKVSRWENRREQGYLISMRSKDRERQLNIAFFQHRSSDDICAVKWEQVSLNPITIETAMFGEGSYKDGDDVSYSVGYGEISKMADWIEEQLISFWKESSLPTE